MKKKMILLFALALIILLITSACSQQQMTGSWQEQYDLGMKYLLEENYEEAIIAFTAAIEIDPKQPLAYVGRGDAYIQLGELDLARADYETALELDETIAEAYLGLVDVYIRGSNFDKALEIVTTGLEMTGDERLAAKKSELDGDNRGSTEDELRSILQLKTGQPPLEFIYDDYDNDGVSEAFALIGQKENFNIDGVNREGYFAEVWFVGKGGATIVWGGDVYTEFHLHTFDNYKVISLDACATDQNDHYYSGYLRVFGVENGTPNEIIYSGKTEDLWKRIGADVSNE